MPKYTIKSTRLDIKSSSLDALIDAYLDQAAPTRAGVARKCHVSASTSGKVATALSDCGFAEQRLYAEKNRRPALHLFINEGLHVMVLDLSRPVYTMSILDPYGKRLFFNSHVFDAGMSYEDNLSVFISRSGYQAKVSGKSFYALSVIFADSCRGASATLSGIDAYVPTMQDKSKTDRIIRSVFKRHTVTYLNLSDALLSSIKFGIIPSTEASFGASYVFIGSQAFALNVSLEGLNRCDIGSFIIGDKTVADLTRNRISSAELSSILSRIVNMMQCAYGPSSVIIDSDVYELDGQLIRHIYGFCAKAGVLAPTVIASNESASISQMGAMKSALSAFIRTMIHASDDQ